MNTPAALPQANALAADVRALNALKTAAGQHSAQATREVARQLESLFMREMIKSMREATLKSGLLDSASGQLGSDLLDQQLALAMSGQGSGLMQAIEQQLARSMGLAPQSAPGQDAPLLHVPSTLSLARPLRSPQVADAPALRPDAPAAPDTAKSRGGSAREQFIIRHSGAAAQVARESGIPAVFLLGQAGHETGWGQARMRCAYGSNAHNLFGIKAGKGWSGRVAEVSTTEYIDGVPRRVKARFRAYDSYEESFRDYAHMLARHPRYAAAYAMRQRTASHWASALQQAGYATDPHYARKLTRAIARAAQVLA